MSVTTLQPGAKWKHKARPMVRATITHVDEFDPGKVYVFFRYDDQDHIGESMLSLKLWLETMQPVDFLPPGVDLPLHGD